MDRLHYLALELQIEKDYYGDVWLPLFAQLAINQTIKQLEIGMKYRD